MNRDQQTIHVPTVPLWFHLYPAVSGSTLQERRGEKAFGNLTLKFSCCQKGRERGCEQANFAYGDFLHLPEPGLGISGHPSTKVGKKSCCLLKATDTASLSHQHRTRQNARGPKQERYFLANVTPKHIQKLKRTACKCSCVLSVSLDDVSFLRESVCSCKVPGKITSLSRDGTGARALPQAQAIQQAFKESVCSI